MKKKTAHVIHHTHWDPLWYFTKEDALIQFNFNMREILAAFKDQSINHFFLDGQTYALEEYLKYHPESQEEVGRLLSENKLFIGPFYNQMDSFITSGESMVTNLQTGLFFAESLGKASRVAYLPDSFGHSYDYPKIFKHAAINDFVITRGVGDQYRLNNEFYMQSNDGSTVLVHVMLSGYGYGTYAFKDGTLLTNEAKDYNLLDVHKLIDRLIMHSSLPGEFVFPLGFDQNPIIKDTDLKLEYYNTHSSKYTFKETTWEAYMDRVKNRANALKVHKDELFSTQFHRVHRSLFSTRADIKTLQDEVERLLAFEVQPLMSMLDYVGVPYEHTIIEKTWKMLMEGQTHASATVTDDVNAFVKTRTKSALHMGQALKAYLMKILAISSKKEGEDTYPLLVFNTLPYKSRSTLTLTLYTKNSDFSVHDEDIPLPYTLLEQTLIDGNVKRKKAVPKDEDKFYYASTIEMETPAFRGMGYRTLLVKEHTDKGKVHPKTRKDKSIDNAFYTLSFKEEEGITLHAKGTKTTMEQAFFLEDMGDEGDNYDYSYPDKDLKVLDDFSEAKVTRQLESEHVAYLVIEGTMAVPKDLKSRRKGMLDTSLAYEVTFTLHKQDDVIDIEGSVENGALNHRLRLVVNHKSPAKHSCAGTQFSIIQRPTHSPDRDEWVEKNYFEEPSPIYPLLNHVTKRNGKETLSVFTRSVKEYEFTGENTGNIALTLFRSVGHLGLPDLNRRPGRPSGIDNEIVETPDSQMKGRNGFRIGVRINDGFDANDIFKTYASYAVNPLYYQNQRFKKTVHRISYFPTNPLPFDIPWSLDFLSFDKAEAAFSTLKKSQKTDVYELRAFNADGTGSIRETFILPTDQFNLFETNLNDSSYHIVRRNATFKHGQLKTFLFKTSEQS